MATVQIRNVIKRFGSSEVVRGVSIDIADGEFVVVVGPSGCGKSTLLRMVAGLETVTEGEILIDGEVVNDVEPKDRNVAMVFQNYALYPHMSVFDNMAYGLRNRGVPKAEIVTKVNEAAGILELDGLLQRRPSQLSGGQRQRVAMGRAIVRSPKVFLFDEPLSNLDAKLRVNMRIEIRRLQRELGITSIYVTHDQVEAMTLADRLVAMNEGRAEQIGTPMEIYDRPSTGFVAGFIGSPPMNFLPCRAEGAALKVGDFVLADAPASGSSLPDRFIAGVRPEHVVIGDAGGPNGAGVRITVDLVEPLGPETLIHAHIDSAHIDRADVDAAAARDGQLTIRTQGRSTAAAGDRLVITARTEDIRFFDDSGHALGA